MLKISPNAVQPPQMLNAVMFAETLAKGLLICRAVRVIVLTIFITCVHDMCA